MSVEIFISQRKQKKIKIKFMAWILGLNPELY